MFILLMEQSMRRFFMAGLFVFTIFFYINAFAQVGVLAYPEPRAGKEYTVLADPVPTSEPNKIVVTEIFWYGCPHCYHLEPIITKWATTLPEDVHLVRMPALVGKLWAIHGQLFITLDMLNVESKLHSAIFESIQTRQNVLLTPDTMADFVAQHGVDRDKFLETYNSFGVQTRMEKDKKIQDKYGINSVPVIIVNGKYKVEFNEEYVTEPQAMMRITNYLIKKEREALSNKSKTTAKKETK